MIGDNGGEVQCFHEASFGSYLKWETRAMLTEGQRTELLRLARSSIAQAIGAVAENQALPAYEAVDEALLEPAAVFVTLRLRTDSLGKESGEVASEGSLRGCIGQVEAEHPLAQAIWESAARAATIDPRFEPVRAAELHDITIEISILSPFRPVDDLASIIVGQDGLLVVGMGRRGLFLPQVATTFHWDAVQFAANTCHKAGLPVGAWPGAAELYAFTTETFAEMTAKGRDNAIQVTGN